MNTQPDMHRQQTLQDRAGLRLAAHLAGGASALPHDIEERLRAARERAVAHRRRPAAVAAAAANPVRVPTPLGATAVLGGGTDPLERWGRIASTALLLALAIGLVSIVSTQNEDRALEVARIDEALLIDALPPQAYTDPGFLQFLNLHDGHLAPHPPGALP